MVQLLTEVGERRVAVEPQVEAGHQAGVLGESVPAIEQYRLEIERFLEQAQARQRQRHLQSCDDMYSIPHEKANHSVND